MDRLTDMTRSPRSRRLVLIGAVAVLGLSGCGSAASSRDTTGAALTPGTDVTKPVTSTTTLASGPAVIDLGVGGRKGVASAGAPEASFDASDGSTIGKMMPSNLTYVFDGDATDLAGTARAWYFPAGVAATQDQATALAAALAVEGDVRAVPVDQGGGWTVGPADYSGPNVSVGSDAMLSWWYSGAQVPMTAPCDVATPIDATDATDAPIETANDVTVAPPCQDQAPPTGTPSPAQADKLAKEFFASIGIDVASYEFETYGDEWSVGVTAYLLVDGLRTNATQYVGYGPDASITWAGGFLAAPVQGDEYPLIGVDAGVQRLNDQSMWMRGYEGGGGVYIDDASIDSSGDGSVDDVIEQGIAPSVDASSGVSAGASTAEGGAAEPPPPVTICDPACPPPAVEPIIVTFIDVAPSLEMQWAEDETIWLLPGYQFSSDDGGTYTVVAVADEFLKTNEPQVDPSGVDTVPVDVGPIEPALSTPAPDGAEDGTENGDPLCASVVMVNVWDPGELSTDDVQFLVGMCTESAIAEGDSLTFSVRVVREDGVDLPVTADFSPNRVNVAVDGGVVTQVVSIG